eukprot:gene15683-biopygen5205
MTPPGGRGRPGGTRCKPTMTWRRAKRRCPRPVRVRFFECYRAARVRSASAAAKEEEAREWEAREPEAERAAEEERKRRLGT